MRTTGRIAGARLQPILEAIRLYKALGVWVEVTTLIIPGVNDSDGELRQIANFVSSVGPEVPWHVTQFSAAYKNARSRVNTDPDAAAGPGDRFRSRIALCL